MSSSSGTCALRRLADHGAINTWDRMPFLHTEGGAPSLTPLPIVIRDNLISATYGASQGVDNDDGSSFYRTHRNVFYAADGFKMDYGGHDSSFTSNLIIVAAYDGQRCVNNLGTRDVYANNTCAVTGTRQPTDLIGDYPCSSPVARTVVVANNTYLTHHANASVKCDNEHIIALSAVQQRYGLDAGSTSHELPSDGTLLDEAVQMVSKWADILPAAEPVSIAPMSQQCTQANKQKAIYLQYDLEPPLHVSPATDISVEHVWNATGDLRRYGTKGVFAAQPIGTSDGVGGYFGSQVHGDELFACW